MESRSPKRFAVAGDYQLLQGGPLCLGLRNDSIYTVVILNSTHNDSVMFILVRVSVSVSA